MHLLCICNDFELVPVDRAYGIYGTSHWAA